MDNLLERFTGELNATHFFAEFTFPGTDFYPSPGEGREFSDAAVVCGDVLVAAQLKERFAGSKGPEATEKWFRKKVRGLGVRQLRNTLEYFEKYDEIIVKNSRGHQVNLKEFGVERVVPIVVYAIRRKRVPPSLLRQRHFLTKGAGFVHVFCIQDYLEACNVLGTPWELARYLDFRRDFLIRDPDGLVAEEQLLAHFIFDEESVPDVEESMDIVSAAKDELGTFSLGPLLAGIGDGTRYESNRAGQTDYYGIIREFSVLPRSMMRAAKERIQAIAEEANEGGVGVPRRIRHPKRDTGFMFISIPDDEFENRAQIVNNIGIAAKYDWKVKRQVCIGMCRDGEFREIVWGYLEWEWEEDEEIERMLADSYPFRSRGREVQLFRYRFPTES